MPSLRACTRYLMQYLPYATPSASHSPNRKLHHSAHLRVCAHNNNETNTTIYIIHFLSCQTGVGMGTYATSGKCIVNPLSLDRHRRASDYEQGREGGRRRDRLKVNPIPGRESRSGPSDRAKTYSTVHSLRWLPRRGKRPSSLPLL